MKNVLVIFFLVTTVILSYSKSAFSFGGCEENCSLCHQLKVEEAQQLVDKFSPDMKINVAGVKTSPSQGLWEINMLTPQGKTITYIDYSKKHIIIGRLINIQTKEDLTKKSIIEVSKVDVSSIPLENSIEMGASNAKHKIIVFTDPQCPFCKKLHEQLHVLVKDRSDIAVNIILFPLVKIHPDSHKVSETIMCSKKPIDALDKFFADGKKDTNDSKCDKKKIIDANIELAGKLGITGTPTVVFPDGRIMAGALTAQYIIKELNNSK